VTAPPGDPATPPGRDRRIVRRALGVGGAIGIGIAAILAVVLSDAAPGIVAAAIWLGLAVGGFVASCWLLLALALDLAARQQPSRGRLVWTAITCLVTLLLPFMVFAGGAAARP
jgi:hypothetical protein